MRLVWATVDEVRGEAKGIQRLSVSLDDGSAGIAIVYTDLCGRCDRGNRVLLNATAVELALGTGGTHFVVSRGLDGGVALDTPSGGHIMKLRYTPLQVDVISVEAQESPHHEVMKGARSLEGMPVVCCGLHSQTPLVAAAVKHAGPNLTVAYCMTDQAALAAPLSDVIRGCREAGLIDATITCGQAFGGDYEAVNLHSGLLAAHHVCAADVTIVAIGPGVVGTATPFGHGGVVQGECINAAHALGGVAVACLRISFADGRSRHRSVSHHSLSALRDVALAPARVAIPTLPTEMACTVDEGLSAAGIWTRHERVVSSAGSVPPPDLRGVHVTTMGRGLAEDPAFFAAAFAAGDVAARIGLAVR